MSRAIAFESYDTENETEDMIISGCAVRIPDSALCIKGYGTSGSNVHVDVVDSIAGPVTLSPGTPIENPIKDARILSTITENGSLVK